MTTDFQAFAAECPFRVDTGGPPPRRGNVVAVEVGTPNDRCTEQQPEHWPEGLALRWLGSGGDPTTFGRCARSQCPKLK